MRTTSGEIKYSVIVPTKDEQATIGKVLEDLRHLTDDLILVDARSQDQTRVIAETYGARVLTDRGRGKGDAVRVGLEAARHPIAVLVDADGSHDAGDVPKLVAPIARGDADLVMGSRMLGGSEELYGSLSEVVRLIGSLIITLCINYRFGVRFTDYQNGLRAIRTDVARALKLTSDSTTIEQEMAMSCIRLGYRVAEIPTHERKRQSGVSRIKVARVAHLYVWSLIKGLLGRRSRPHAV